MRDLDAFWVAAQKGGDISQELAAEILEIQMDDKVLIEVADVVAAPMAEALTSRRPDLTPELKSKIHIHVRDFFVELVPGIRTPWSSSWRSTTRSRSFASC